jgi:hypothetical protein
VTRVAAVLLLVALCAAGCGSESVVSQTGKNLGKIHSGVLKLRLMVTPRDGSDPFGFELAGPFALQADKLPVMRIAYTQVANGTSATATLVSNGARAWVVSDQGTHELGEAEARSLRTPATLGGMDIGSWIRDESVSNGPDGTERVSGKIDVVAVANGLRNVAALAGRNLGSIEGSDAERLRKALRASSVELLTSKEGHLLRRLALSADLGFAVPQSLKRALGTTVGAKVDFVFGVTRPNSRVVVTGP